VSKKFGEWYQKTNKTKDTNKLTLLAFKISPPTVLSCSGACTHQIRGVRWVDFFLFPRLKSIMKGVRFADVAAIKERVTAVLRSVPIEAFADRFKKFMNVANSVL
jgi:hypothetical protein